MAPGADLPRRHGWLLYGVLLLAAVLGSTGLAVSQGALVGAVRHGAQSTADRVLLRTTCGDIVVVLYADAAPAHVEQILQLVRHGVYDTTHIYRVEPTFLVQTSDANDRRIPLSAAQRSVLRPIPFERNEFLHRRGSLTMARRLDDLNSAESSFSILLVDAPHLDGDFTVFGRVEWGWDVLDEICRAPRDENNRPEERIEIEKATVVPPGATREELELRDATPVQGRGSDIGARSALGWLVGTLALLGGIVMVAARRGAHRLAGALGGIIAFLGVLSLLVLYGAETQRQSLLALVLFIGLLVSFKLLSRFEEARGR